jgi:hypothetical protein
MDFLLRHWERWQLLGCQARLIDCCPSQQVVIGLIPALLPVHLGCCRAGKAPLSFHQILRDASLHREDK